MLPGGEDIFFEVSDPVSHRSLVVEVIRSTWKTAVIEDADGDFLGPDTKEILAYRNGDSRASWMRDGATATNGDDMLHVLFGATEITCVVDGPDTMRMANQIQVRTTKSKP